MHVLEAASPCSSHTAAAGDGDVAVGSGGDDNDAVVVAAAAVAAVEYGAPIVLAVGSSPQTKRRLNRSHQCGTKLLQDQSTL